MKTILLVGIPGSGKSSILQEILRQIPSVLIVNYGDKMLEEAKAEGITRDLLRKLPIQDQQRIGISAAKKIMDSRGDKITIIDTHALIRTSTGYCPGLPLEVLKILSPRACAWVECSPSIILQRRKKDPSRTRDEESEEQLSTHQQLTSSFLTACSLLTGAILCRVLNNSPAIDQNALSLVQLIHAISEEPS